MTTGRICNQWFDMNRAVLEPFMRWNEVMLQSAERVTGNRQLFEQWFELNRAAFEPMLRWNEIAFSAAERITRRNLNLAHDYLDLGVRQLNLLSESRDPEKFADEEGKLAAEFGQKIAGHAGDYLKVARETQDALNQWADESAQRTAEAAQRAADTTARATSEAARGAAQRSGAGQPPQPGGQQPPVHR